MNPPTYCKDCGFAMGWHDEHGVLSPAFGGMAPCPDAAEYKAKQEEEAKPQPERA